MSHCKAASSELPNSVLKDLSQLVDSALSQAPLCSDSLAASQADYLPAARHHLTQRTGHSAAAAPNPTAELGSTSKQHQQSEAGQTCADVHTKGGITTYVKDSLASGVSSKTIGSKKVNKPAWALTADAARDVEQQEEEDLLAFAGGLEFDKYIDEQEDAELKTVLQVLAALQTFCQCLILGRQRLPECTCAVFSYSGCIMWCHPMLSNPMFFAAQSHYTCRSM